MSTTKSKKAVCPDLNEWWSFNDVAYKWRESLWSTFGITGLFGFGFVGDANLERKRRLTALQANAAFHWLVQVPAVQEAVERFGKTVSSDSNDCLRLIVAIGYHYDRFLRGQRFPKFFADPPKSVRLQASDLALKLEKLVSRERAGFEDKFSDYSFEQSLKAYGAEQLRLAQRRKSREDSTSNERRFILELAQSMLNEFGRCQPMHLKPLGALVDYQLDDRGWTRLLSIARRKHRPKVAVPDQVT